MERKKLAALKEPHNSPKACKQLVQMLEKDIAEQTAAPSSFKLDPQARSILLNTVPPALKQLAKNAPALWFEKITAPDQALGRVDTNLSRHHLKAAEELVKKSPAYGGWKKKAMQSVDTKKGPTASCMRAKKVDAAVTAIIGNELFFVEHEGVKLNHLCDVAYHAMQLALNGDSAAAAKGLKALANHKHDHGTISNENAKKLFDKMCCAFFSNAMKGMKLEQILKWYLFEFLDSDGQKWNFNF